MAHGQQFSEDLRFVTETVARVHPRPDYRASQSELNTALDLCRAKVTACTTVEEFWLVLQEYLRVMGDAHTSVDVPETASMVQAPMHTVLVAGEVVVADVLSPMHGVRQGQRVVAVGSSDIQRRLREVMLYSPSNTERYARRQAAANALLFVGASAGSIAVTLADPDGTIREASVPLLPLDAPVHREARTLAQRRLLAGSVLGSVLPDCGIGYLRFRSCVDRITAVPSELESLGMSPATVPDMEETCWAFFGHLDECGVGALVLDLRGNGGGNSAVGELLLKYLTRDPVPTYCGGVLTFPYRSRLDDHRLARVPQFFGRVYILIDSGVFSSGEWLAAELRAAALGVFLGEPTGGGGAVPGNQRRFQLPNTGLTLHVSSMFFVPPGGELVQKRGVYPDFWVTTTIEDICRGTDSALEYARMLSAGDAAERTPTSS